MSKGKHIAVIGDGTYVVLTALKKFPVYLSAIVLMADDGGSTGLLRQEFGLLPAGDVRRALTALSNHPDEFITRLFNYRFSEGSLNGHNFGNFVIAVLERVCGSFEKAVEAASKLLAVEKGEVIPVSFDDVRLFAELADGSVIKGESNIDIPKHNGEITIEKIWLEPQAKANAKALKAIRDAGLIIIGPGDLYTSIIPNFLVKGIVEALAESRAKKIYICNLMTKYGETHGFVAYDFVNVLEKYIGFGVLDAVIINNQRPPENILGRYRKEKAFFIDPFFSNPAGAKKPKIIKTNLISKGDLIRHNKEKLAEIALKFI